jgi:hypothetical protein
MFEGSAAVTVEGLEALVSALSQVGGSGDVAVEDALRIDQLAALERVKAAAAAAQVRVTAAFVDSQEQVAQVWRERARECSAAGDFEGWRAAREQARAASLAQQQASDDGQAGAGSGRRRRGPSGMTGVAAQVALARRESPVRGGQHVRLALALTSDLPHALAALEAGELSERRAQILVRETAALSPEHRRLVDAEVIGEVVGGLGEHVGSLGDRELTRRVRAVAYRLDAASVLARAARAQADRRVTIRPAPDTMAYLTALLPVAQAVAAHAALTLAADAARAAGDERGKGQVMADTLVTRLTGQATADAVPVEVQLVMTDRALLDGGPGGRLGGGPGGDTPAQLTGYGTVPAAWARALLTPTGTEGDASVWLRRLYTHPGTGALVAMDSTRRVFDGGLRRYLLARDAGACRTPWCDAPARHVDHVTGHADGGPTSADNGQGLCVRCNHTKQLPGWIARTLARTLAPPLAPPLPHPSPHPDAPATPQTPGTPQTPATPQTPGTREIPASRTPSRPSPRPGTVTARPRHPYSPDFPDCPDRRR